MFAEKARGFWESPTARAGNLVWGGIPTPLKPLGGGGAPPPPIGPYPPGRPRQCLRTGWSWQGPYVFKGIPGLSFDPTCPTIFYHRTAV